MYTSVVLVARDEILYNFEYAVVHECLCDNATERPSAAAKSNRMSPRLTMIKRLPTRCRSYIKNWHKASRLLLSISTAAGKRGRSKSGYATQKAVCDTRRRGAFLPRSDTSAHLHFQAHRVPEDCGSSVVSSQRRKFHVSYVNITLQINLRISRSGSYYRADERRRDRARRYSDVIRKSTIATIAR